MTLFRLKLTLENRIGMIKTISEILYSMEINIDELHTKKISKDATIVTIALEIPDYEYLIVDRFLDRVNNAL